MSRVEIISEYWSDDGKLKAEIVNVGSGEREWGTDMVYFYADGKFVGSEAYDGHSLDYLESAAENYVLGIKRL